MTVAELKYFLVPYKRHGARDEENEIVLAASSSLAIRQMEEREGGTFASISGLPLDMSKVLTKIKLNKLYKQDWWHVSKILRSFWVKLPKTKKGEVSRYLITKPLPTQEEFDARMAKHYTTSAQGLVEDANGEIDALKDEISEWKDSLPESFAGGDKESQLEEALEQLERYDELQWPDEIPDFNVVYIPPVPKIFRGREQHSRSSRLSEALDKLQLVHDELDGQKEFLLEKQNTLMAEYEGHKDAIDEKNEEMKEKKEKALEIREAWEAYDGDQTDYEENLNDPNYDKSALVKPESPQKLLVDAETLEKEAGDIETAKDELELNLGDWEKQHEDFDPEISADELESAIDEFMGEIENQRSEVENVEFPGMFG